MKFTWIRVVWFCFGLFSIGLGASTIYPWFEAASTSYVNPRGAFCLQIYFIAIGGALLAHSLRRQATRPAPHAFLSEKQMRGWEARRRMGIFHFSLIYGSLGIGCTSGVALFLLMVLYGAHGQYIPLALAFPLMGFFFGANYWAAAERDYQAWREATGDGSLASPELS